MAVVGAAGMFFLWGKPKRVEFGLITFSCWIPRTFAVVVPMILCFPSVKHNQQFLIPPGMLRGHPLLSVSSFGATHKRVLKSLVVSVAAT